MGSAARRRRGGAGDAHLFAVAQQVRAQGDQVVALGAHLLREGEKVRVAASAAPAAAGGARP